MALEGLRERLREAWAEQSAKIIESSAFNQLREKFEEQSATTQKALIAGAVLLVILAALSVPFGYLNTARENVAQFEENRALIQGLLRAARSAKEPSPLPPPVGAATLRGGLERVLHENQVSPEQFGDVQPSGGIPALAPAAVTQTGLVANIKSLTLTQIVSVATGLSNLGPGTKLIGLDVVQTAGQDHYYDINVRLINFGLPAAPTEFDSGSARPIKNQKPSSPAPRPAQPEFPAGGEDEE